MSLGVIPSEVEGSRGVLGAGENQCTVNMVGWSDSPREIDSPRLAYKARPFHLGFQAAVRAAALYETRELLRWQNYTEMAAFAELFVIKSRDSQLWHGPVIVLCASDEQGVRLGSLRTLMKRPSK